jgi:NAD(P)-dependent dehydrogenase (short-subunit alcohol dehydrogenase family)
MLKGKSVLITGTTSGIGRAIARALAVGGGVVQ